MGKGRPFGEGLWYMQLDTDVAHNTKLEQMEKKFGPAGFSFTVKVWCQVFNYSYYWSIDKNIIETFCEKTLMLPQDDFYSMMDFAFDLNILNRDLYERFNILTSEGIQERYLIITKLKKWKKVKMADDYMIKSINLDPYKIHITTLNGQLKYIKPRIDIGSTDKRVIKDIPKEDPIPEVIIQKNLTQVPASLPAQPVIIPAVDIVDKWIVTTQEIQAFCSKNYDEENEIFQKHIARSWFESFVRFNALIDEKYPRLRLSNYQITLEKYKDIVKNGIDGKGTKEDILKKALHKLASGDIKLHFDLSLKLLDHIGYIKDNINGVYLNGSSTQMVRTGLPIDHSKK